MGEAPQGRTNLDPETVMNPIYLDAVRLLLDVAPAVFRNPLFALKGGTAINLFVREMPRLSVDLDLVITDHTQSRDDALVAVSAELESIRREITGTLDVRCELGAMAQGPEVKLFVERGRTRIKVEVNHVFRGTLLQPENRPLSAVAQDLFFLGLVKGEPDWSLMKCQHLREMPAIRWKLENLARLKKTNPAKFVRQAAEVETRF
jgi:hypothetical protein